MGEPLIEGVKLYPNPNSGQFVLAVKLSRESDINVGIYNGSKAGLIDYQKYFGKDNYEIPYSFPDLRTGIYVILVRAESEQKIIKIIVD